MQMQIGSFTFELKPEYQRAAWTWRRRWAQRAPLRAEVGMAAATPGASGEHIGNWVVSQIVERHRDLRTRAGIPARVEFEIRMMEAVQ